MNAPIIFKFMFQGFQQYHEFENADLPFGFEGEPDLFYRSVDLHLSTVQEGTSSLSIIT